MNAGDRSQFQCESCSREFDIVYESKLEGAADSDKQAANIDPAEVTHCPFCGSTSVSNPYE